MRKFLIIVAALALTAPASAQSSNVPSYGGAVPKTVIIRGPGGQTIGTVTSDGTTAYHRDAKGELTGSSQVAADGTETFYDPNGKITGTSKTEHGVTTKRDAAGQITGTVTQESDGTVTTRDASGQITGSSNIKIGKP